MIGLKSPIARLVLPGLLQSLLFACSGSKDSGNATIMGGTGSTIVGGATTSAPVTGGASGAGTAGSSSRASGTGGTATTLSVSTGGATQAAIFGGASGVGGQTTTAPVGTTSGGTQAIVSTALSSGGTTSTAGGTPTLGGTTSLLGGTSSTGETLSTSGGMVNAGGTVSIGNTGGAALLGGASNANNTTGAGAANTGGATHTGGSDATGGNEASGGSSSIGGNTSGWQNGCYPRLGGLPEIAPSGVGDIGDVNGDGILDVVLGAITGNNVRVLLGRGNGVYGAARNYGTDGSPSAISIGDLNGDKVLDIATRNSDTGNISILKGNGDGTFILSTPIAAGSDSGGGFPKRNLVLADVTGDGRLDILTAHWDQTLSIAVGMSNGTFTRLSPISIGHSATQLAVADLNHDQNLDLIVNHGYSNQVTVLISTGGGTFAAPVHYTPFSSWYTESLAVGDVDKDGDPDIVVGNGAGASIAVLKNDGSGTFSLPTTATNVSGAVNYVTNTQLTDLEGDGDLDLLVNVSGNGALYYLWNDGTGEFRTITRDYVANAGVDIRVGDSNGDGTKDLFLFGYKFLTLLGRSGGKFDSQKYLALSESGTKPTSVAVGDLDGVGVLDVALANETPNTDAVFRLDANGAYMVPEMYTVGNKPSFVRAADVTGDGKTDLVNLNYQDGTINVMKNQGTGLFTVLTAFSTLGFENWFDLKDVNEDGALDIIMLSGTFTCIYPGTGTGAFGACSALSVSPNLQMEAMALGDVNGDGHLDMVLRGKSTVMVWSGKGDGTFTNLNTFNCGTDGTPAIALADLNHDDKLDLVLSDNSYGVSAWLGNADGSFTRTPTNPPLFGLPNYLQIADMNRDGHADIVAANSEGNFIALVLGLGDGTFAPTYFTFPAGERPMDLAVADLDKDGWLDVATAGYDSSSGGVLFGGPPVCPLN